MNLIGDVVPARLVRSRFQGTFQILQYNWPFYVKTLLACSIASAAVVLLPVSWVLKGVVGLGIAGALYFSIGSLLASWWVYDHSELSRWDWIASLFPVAPKHWVNIHAGLDETSIDLRRLFPGSESVVLDIYDPSEMTEPSIKRARTLTPSLVPAFPADIAALPFADGELDTVFLIFTAHEIRDPDARLRFFVELRRVLASHGKLLLVEHVRDLPNFAVFGPGFMHFMPRSEWSRLARQSGFAVEKEFVITPFVRVWLLEVQGPKSKVPGLDS